MFPDIYAQISLVAGPIIFANKVRICLKKKKTPTKRLRTLPILTPFTQKTTCIHKENIYSEYEDPVLKIHVPLTVTLKCKLVF